MARDKTGKVRYRVTGSAGCYQLAKVFLGTRGDLTLAREVPRLALAEQFALAEWLTVDP